MNQYTKPWRSVSDQLQQLTDRGLQVQNRGRSLECLERVGYYRLSGYLYDLRSRSAFCPLDPATGGKPRKVRIERPVLDEFKPGARFEDGMALYVFDKRLRLLALDALERIEVAIRSQMAHTLGRQDPFAYLKPDFFHAKFTQELDPRSGLCGHHSWLSKHAGLIGRSKEEFMRHNRDKYGLPVAIWVACEVWDFGCMSTLFGGMREVDQDEISQRYGIHNGRVFASWLRALNYLRNVCAHHSRLWNRNVVEEPKLPALGEVPELDVFHGSGGAPAHARTRVFLLLCLCRHLLRTVHPDTEWGLRLRELLGNRFPDLTHVGLTLQGMGVTDRWQETLAKLEAPKKNPQAVGAEALH